MTAMDAAFETYMETLEELHAELVAAPRHRPEVLLPLISSFLAAHRDYYEAKACLADVDVLRVVTPYWVTPFERTFVWIGGWKPYLSFRLLPGSYDRRSSNDDDNACGGAATACGLTGEQRAAVERLKRETAAAEHRLSEQMAQTQEAMAGQAALAAVRGLPSRNGDARVEASEAVLRALRDVVVEADELRRMTVVRIVEILSPAQAADFLVATAELRLRLRHWGLQRSGARTRGF